MNVPTEKAPNNIGFVSFCSLLGKMFDKTSFKSFSILLLQTALNILMRLLVVNQRILKTYADKLQSFQSQFIFQLFKTIISHKQLKIRLHDLDKKSYQNGKNVVH